MTYCTQDGREVHTFTVNNPVTQKRHIVQRLEDGATLERYTNSIGVAFSAICRKGRVITSCSRDCEKELLRYHQELEQMAAKRK